MAFTDRQKAIAMAIIKVFETGKPLGDYAAVAVLNDGAGISYGISQFTHKSGSLYAVLARFQKLGGTLPAAVTGVLSDIKAKTNITAVSNSSPVKNVLKTLGKDALMQQAQREIAFEKYLQPSIKVCEGSGFVHPLSLAVIYDSKVHGSYDKVRDRVPSGLGEKEWIARYVDEREKWLKSIKRLASTAYRPQTFRNLIKANNWALNLPLIAHGRTITAKELGVSAKEETSTSKKSLQVELLENIEQPPTETPDVNVTVTNEPPSDIKPAEVTSPEPYQGVGFWAVIKKDLAVATGGNLSFATLQEYAQQASGWPEWLVGIITKLAVGVLIATFGYFVFRVVHYGVDTWKKSQKAKTEAQAASDPTKADIKWV